MSRSMVRSFVFFLVFISVLAVTIFNTGCVGVTAAAPAATAQSTQTARRHFNFSANGFSVDRRKPAVYGHCQRNQ